VSFDIFIQRFARGDAAEVDVVLICEALREFVSEELADDRQSVTTADGGADIYGLGSPDGLMINHAAGDVIWDAVVSVADAAGLTIIPVGYPACVTRPELLDELPSELRDQTRVVSTGLELRRVIAG
jgi:hypothetical protein